METILQQIDTPPCVIIDEKLNIVYVHGRTGKLFNRIETERLTKAGNIIKVWVMVLALGDERDRINGAVTIERSINDAK